MPDLLCSVARLTGCRDRDLLDVTVVELVAGWLQPLELCLYRCVGPTAELRLLPRASARRGATTQPGPATWTPLESLVALADRPQHRAAIDHGLAIVTADTSGRAPGETWHLLPVAAGGASFGLLELRTERPLTVEQRRLVDGVLTIYGHQLRLLDYSERDTLTGLLNRKTFDEQFGKCLRPLAPLQAAPPPGTAERREPGGASHWLGVIDVDHFKRVNDGHGHVIGDEVLLLLAQLLQSCFRYGDRLYRFGGEEFVVLLRADGRANAHGAFERLRAWVERAVFPQVGQVTVSAGFTEVRGLDTGTAAFERADRAVYHAKQQGRNRVFCHETLIESGALQENAPSGDVELF
jgi:diguanylate cyclase (GGDEF)-like protein